MCRRKKGFQHKRRLQSKRGMWPHICWLRCFPSKKNSFKERRWEPIRRAASTQILREAACHFVPFLKLPDCVWLLSPGQTNPKSLSNGTLSTSCIYCWKIYDVYNVSSSLVSDMKQFADFVSAEWRQKWRNFIPSCKTGLISRLKTPLKKKNSHKTAEVARIDGFAVKRFKKKRVILNQWPNWDD